MPRSRKRVTTDREIPRGTAFIADKRGVHGTPSDPDRAGRTAYAASSVIERGTADKLKAKASADEPHFCLCGCGQQPSSTDSMFMPGHDSKVRAIGKAVKEGKIERAKVYKPALEYLEQGGML